MQIDLREINGIVADIMLDYYDAVMDNEDLTAKSWGYETGQIFSHEKAKKIADALEQLPKLVEALRGMVVSFSADENTRDEAESVYAANKALEPFTNQPQP